MIIRFDDELRDSLDILISGLLPHENYDSLLFMDIHENILRYIKEDEMPLEYKVLFGIIKDVIKINISTSKFNPLITNQAVDTVLSNSLVLFLSEEGYKYKDWFENKGLGTDFNISTVLETASSKLYGEVMELYERCFNKKVASSEALSTVIGYKNCFLECVGITAISIQADIIQSGVKHGKKFYKGPNGWVEYMNYAMMELNSRLNDELHVESSNVNTLEKAINYLDKARNRAVPISKFGIPPLDDYIPIVSNRFSVICADEGVGKTQFCTYLANNVIRDNKKVLFMFGESDASELFTMVLRNFIYKKFDRFVDVNDILYPEQSDEDVQTLINLAIVEFYKTGCYIDREAYTYENLYQELVADYEAYKMDVIFIDHSAALKSTGLLRTEKERIDALSVAVRDFKRKYPCHVFVTSHLSVEGRDELKRHGKIFYSSPTRGSGTLSKEADDVMVISVDEKQEKQDLRGIHVTKRRGTAKHTIGSIIMKVFYRGGEWYYDKKLQNDEHNELGVESAIRNLEGIYSEDEDDEIVIEL